jgi:hypothetical protein
MGILLGGLSFLRAAAPQWLNGYLSHDPLAERGIPRAPLRLEPGAMAPNEVKAEKVDIQYPPSAPAARSTPVSGLSADASTTRAASFFGAALVVYRGNFFASARCC